MKIEVYSDGSATSDCKPGGYGWVMVKDGVKHSEGNGHMDRASNNDAELEAAIQGLIAVFKVLPMHTLENGGTQPRVELVSDSQLVLGWADGTYRFKQAAKMDKFNALRALVQRMGVTTRWVRGHMGDEHNERCDKLANEARTGKERADKKPKKIKEPNDSKIGTKKTSIFCVWHEETLKVVDLENNLVEDYNRDIHGPRGSQMVIKKEKERAG